MDEIRYGSETKSKVNLKIMRCPTCGGSLKIENTDEAIVCVYCGNSIVPIENSAAEPRSESSVGSFGGVLKIEGIKTPSSALAYMEQLFEEYDWEAFGYGQNLSIDEVDRLVSSLKVSSADDKNTWIACFKAISIPYVKKYRAYTKILDLIISDYKNDNPDAYSKFDAYRRISLSLSVAKASVTAKLEKIISNAEKYGASSQEITNMKSDVDFIKNISVDVTYSDIEKIPEIEEFIAQKNLAIIKELANEGIDAGVEYMNAKMFIEQNNYVAALNTLIKLKGYADTEAMIEKLDKYFLISDILEIEGTLYVFSKSSSSSYNLYKTADGKLTDVVVVSNISKIITNYANILYYLDDNSHLSSCALPGNNVLKLFDKSLNKDSIHFYDRKVYFTTSDYYGSTNGNELVELDISTGAVRTLLVNIGEILSLIDNKLVVSLLKKDGNSFSQNSTCVLDVENQVGTELGVGKISVKGFVDNKVVYTQKSPNKFNYDLYMKELVSNEPAQLIEKNIFDFCDIISDKLFYYVGNSRNKSLININCDGSERKEWAQYIDRILFEQGGWIYFIRRIRYNSIVCRTRLDGSRFGIIASDIESFVEIKNGYLYYLNSDSDLVKVRMDGSNLQTLCEDVEKVLSVQEDKIVFISIDDRIIVNEQDQPGHKFVKSIYAVDFSGSGKRKLAYNVINADEYDDNTIYFISEKKTLRAEDSVEERFKVLHKLDVETYQIDELLSTKPTKSQDMSLTAVITVIAFIVFIMGIVAESSMCTILGAIIGLCGIFMLAIKKSDSLG